MAETFLSRDEEADLAARAAKGDAAAADRLISSHLPFVRAVARRYSRYGAPVNDLVQEGVIGLIHAVRKFNPESGVRLSTYAGWWVRVAIQEHVVSSWSLVRIGTTSAQKRLFFRLRQLASDLSRDDGPMEEALRRLATRLRIRPEELQTLARRIAGRDQSLNQPIARSGAGDDWLGRVPDSRPDPEAQTAALRDGRFWSDKLHRALAALPERERRIISRRYLDGRKIPLEAVARDVGLSKERVRQLEARALDELRRLMSAALLQQGGAAMPAEE
ncbi:RNA polymerase sigma-32 factor [Constrictibacter sp. MBR-5]|jgi:RNA polymerase sigma-32 factor|uniref:sigma-70 family RNA polymerase sigma factor n=1 Tax=Constrictibacter sp. MBR-5 TaxID=3156467 RepID=UPI003397A172